MILTLVLKLLRDLRLTLFVTASLLCLFQVFWTKIMERIIAQLAPFFYGMAGYSGIDIKQVEKVVFDGPGKLIRSIIGGETIDLNNAMDMFTIAYVHPLVQTIICIWAVGRAAGALAGEIDRGTMELLLSQPIGRGTLILAHLIVDIITIPLICLSMWFGSYVGYWLVNPLTLKEYDNLPKIQKVDIEFGIAGLKVKIKDPTLTASAPVQTKMQPGEGRLALHPELLGKGLLATGGLIFAITGITMAISATGRFRFRVLGYAVFLILIMFLVNVISQVWEPLMPLRPLTIFYYYQPQQMILGRGWSVNFSEWNQGEALFQLPCLLVLYGVGTLGYLISWRIFERRDIPAPI